MNVNSISGVQNNQSQSVGAKNQLNDALTQSLQKQINDAQQQIRDLAENDTMTSEEKMKKRQEIQQYIAELNNQLRQHQMELKREEREKAQEEIKKSAENSSNADKNDDSMSQINMKSLISADSAIGQAKESGKAAIKLKGREGVLNSEIKLDKSRGVDVEDKLEELSKTKQGIYNAETRQFGVLKDAREELEEAEENKEEAEKNDVKRYTKDGKPVEEEKEPEVSVLV